LLSWWWWWWWWWSIQTEIEEVLGLGTVKGRIVVVTKGINATRGGDRRMLMRRGKGGEVAGEGGDRRLLSGGRGLGRKRMGEMRRSQRVRLSR